MKEWNHDPSVLDTTLKDWDFQYLKFCCHIIGMQDHDDLLKNRVSCEAYNLEKVKGPYFCDIFQDSFRSSSP